MGGKIHSLDIVRKSKNVRTRADFAALIIEAWQSSVAGFIKAGLWLETAKAELDHGEWLLMIKNDLPFGEDTAQRLKKIASSTLLSNTDHDRYLPASWQTLYELAKLDEPTFTAAIADGRINPKMERKDVKALRPDAKPRKPRQEPKPARPAARPKSLGIGPVVTPIDTCCMAFRSSVRTTVSELEPAQWDDLLTELRSELADLETYIARRRQERESQ